MLLLPKTTESWGTVQVFNWCSACLAFQRPPPGQQDAPSHLYPSFLPPSLSPLRPASPVTAHPLPRARPYHAPSFASFVHRQLLQRPSSSSVPVLRPTHLPHPRPHSILP